MIEVRTNYLIVLRIKICTQESLSIEHQLYVCDGGGRGVQVNTFEQVVGRVPSVMGRGPMMG